MQFLPRSAWVAVATIAFTALITLTSPSAGQGKSDIYKPILPAEEYTKLIQSELKLIKDALKEKVTKKEINKARTSAVMLAHYAQSQGFNGLRDEALKVQDLLTKNKINDAKSWADSFMPKFEKGGDSKPVELHTILDIDDLMHQFGRGGLSLEKRLGDLRKKTTDMNEAAEVAARIATIAQLTEAYAPDRDLGQKKKASWVKWSNNMRDAAVRMLAATKKSPAEVQKAAGAVETSCSDCHSVFRE
jgi:hypothetical protein